MQNENSSATAATSFVLDGNPPSEAQKNIHKLTLRLETLRREMVDLETLPMPVPKLYQKARAANLSRMKTEERDLLEAIAYEKTQV